ncbi:MAG: prepilin-type N-terminal cleavage/methylation domain-containing protein [Candidatus Marinamargulisbacteria bacterium]|jgi:prepilin-type N-terminal cleavage/methylation domain-containing protein
MNKKPVASFWQRGYSLIELAIVISIVAMVAAITIPNVINMVKKHAVNAAADLLVNEYFLTRTEARIERKPHKIVFAPGGAVFETYQANEATDTWELERESEPFKNGVTLFSTEFTDDQVLFNIRGHVFDADVSAMPSAVEATPLVSTKNIVLSSQFHQITLEVRADGGIEEQ